MRSQHCAAPRGHANHAATTYIRQSNRCKDCLLVRTRIVVEKSISQLHGRGDVKGLCRQRQCATMSRPSMHDAAYAVWANAALPEPPTYAKIPLLPQPFMAEFSQPAFACDAIALHMPITGEPSSTTLIRKSNGKLAFSSAVASALKPLRLVKAKRGMLTVFAEQHIEIVAHLGRSLLQSHHTVAHPNSAHLRESRIKLQQAGS